ncbi:MAG: hypothetical protein HY700_08045 [Gemmatimonadetes bacterium]|nr:hypothetical protein [Gemmatimonadota bacterium]
MLTNDDDATRSAERRRTSVHALLREHHGLRERLRAIPTSFEVAHPSLASTIEILMEDLARCNL